jgi:uncharacterized coiled-coil protein SlyX
MAELFAFLFAVGFGCVLIGMYSRIKELEGEVAFQKDLVRGWEETFKRLKSEGRIAQK